METGAIADPEVALALAYAPPRARGGLGALWALDDALAAMVAAAREPMLVQLRLAWWRDQLAALGGEGPPPVDPLLRRLEAEVAPHVARGALAPLAEGWSALLDVPEIDAAMLAEHGDARGGALFGAAAALLGGEAPVGLAEAGAVWALVDSARRGLAPAQALQLAGARLGAVGDVRWPRALRPLGMLAALAVRDARAGAVGRQGAPGRLLAMVRHRFSGRIGLGAGGARR